MPTDVQHFSRGYKGKKTRSPRRNRVAEHQGRTPQPGVPTGPRNAPTRTKAERRNAAVAAALKPKPLHAPTKAERRQRAAAERLIRHTLGDGVRQRAKEAREGPKVPTLQPRSTISKGPSKDELLELAVEKDIIKPQQEAGHLPKHKTLGQEAYGKLAEWGPLLITEAPAAAEGVRAAVAAARGVKAGDEIVGGSKILSRVLKPAEATSSADRAAVTERAAARAAAREGSGVKAAARRAGERATRAQSKADAAVARRVAGRATRRETAAAAGAPLKVAKVTASQTLPVVRGHERSLLHKKTYETTARMIPGLVTAPVGQVIGLGITGGRAISQGAHELGIPGARGYTGKQILEPAENIGKEQLAFAKQVAKTLTADDSAEVQKAVEDELGLMLPIALGLVGKAAGDRITKGRVLDATRKIVEQARSSVGKGHGRHAGQTPRIFEKAGQHKAESVRVARSKSRSRREIQARTKDVRREAGKAKGSEVIRPGVGTRSRLTGRRRGLKVHAGDIVNFAVRHSLPLDKPAAALAEVKRIGSTFKPLPEGYVPPVDQISSRDLVAFIERNPHVLADKHLRREIEAARGQARYSREHASELEPEHSEVARFTSAAVTRDVPLKSERFPTSVRDVTRAEPTRGRSAKDVLRRESRSDRQRARRLGKKAARGENRAGIMRREAEIRASQVEPRTATEQARQAKIKRLEARRAAIAAKRQGLRDKGSTSKLMTQYRRAQEKINRQLVELQVDPMTARKKQRIQLERHASGRAAVAGKQRRLAQAAREAATRKHHAATEVDPAVEREFLTDISGRLKKEGLPEPEYTHTGRANGVSTSGMTGSSITRFPGRSKHRAGTAEEYGMVQEGLGPYLRSSIAKPISTRESFKALRSFLEDNQYRQGDRVEFTPDEVQHLVNEGKIDLRNYVSIPRQESKRAFDPSEYAARLRASLDATDDLSAPRVRLVRRPAAEEFASQLSNAAIAPKLAKINRVTSYLILGTSPAWATAQIVAEYAQGAAAQPKILNPLFVGKAIKAYKALPPEKRWAFDSWLGVTARDLDTPGELKFDPITGNPGSASDAWSVMNRTPLGRAIKSIPHGIQRIDQWKGGGIRMLTAAAKIDHDLNVRGGGFLRGIRGLSEEIGKASAEMRGKPLSEQLAYVGDHPQLEHHFATYLDDVMGNWSALTRNERIASQIAIFYPFIRMSLRWTFYSFPKRHPLKAAAFTYLAQQNAVTLKKFLGRDPTYFNEWANVPIKLGPGETKIIPLSRITPGGNTAVELGGEGSLKGLLLKSAQPVLAAAIEAETGVNPMTLAQEPDSLLGAASQLWSLTGAVRAADELLVPEGRKRAKNAPPIFGSTERQEALDKLFNKLGEARTPAKAARTLAVPLLPKDGGYVRDLTKLRAVLGTLSENSSSKRQDIETAWAYKHQGGSRKQIDATLSAMEAKYERADKALTNLFVKYKIPHVAEEEVGGRRYDEIHYGAKPGKGTTSFGGASIPTPEKGGPTATESGVSSFGGKAAAGPVAKPPKEPRFYEPKSKASTFGGKPAR